MINSVFAFNFAGGQYILKFRTNFIHAFSIAFALAAAGACAPQKKNFFSKSYHNTTALYNAYFIAREDIQIVEAAIEKSHRNDYDRTLMVFSDIDSATIDGLRDRLEDCIQKASLAIQRHENSKWVDDSYYLIGKARFYGGDFVNAIETFKYVNTRSDDENQRHAALIALLRTFVHYDEFNNAQAVSDYLQKQRLNRSNLKDLYLTRAYMYQLSGNRTQLAHNLSEAAKLEKRKKENARRYYILGQLYQDEGLDEQAYESYRKSLKSNPDYELSFYTRIKMAQVSRPGHTADAKKVNRFFSSMLKDSKNREFRDRIYFEMANYDLKQGNTGAAIENLRAAAAEASGTSKIRGMAFHRLAVLYYDDLKSYALAKAYYDSTVAIFPKDDPRYADILARQQILGEFVEQIQIIQTQDSLLALAAMAPDDLDRYLDQVVAEKIERQQELERQERQLEARQRQPDPMGFDQSTWASVGAGPAEELSGAQWYFYNAAAISQGQNEFRRRWGTRTLEDHWRRSRKESIASFDDRSTGSDAGEREEAIDERAGSDPDQLKAAMMSSIPFSEDQKAEALLSVEGAYFRLGNLYYFDLKEPDNARQTFETMIRRFPDSEHAAEVLYQLFLICSVSDTAAAESYRDRLVAAFPSSLYARLALNPNYQEESSEVSDRLRQLYQVAYGYYESGDYNQAGLLVRRGLEQFPDNDFSDYLRILDIMILGKEEGQYKYQYELQQFIETRPESSLIAYANNLLEASRNFEVNEARRSGARYLPRFDEPHLFVVVYESNPSLVDVVGGVMEDYIREGQIDPDLNVGNMTFDDQQAVVLVSKFVSREGAQRFLQEYRKNGILSGRFDGFVFRDFVITESNFQLLFRSKRLDDYLAFYRTNYPD